MATWISVVVVVAIAVAAGVLRERWRITAIENWARTRGFLVRSPFVPAGHPPAEALAARFVVRGARIWGVGVEGAFDGVPLTIAEHEVSRPGRKTGVWYTLLVWPLSGVPGPVVIWRLPPAPMTEAVLPGLVGDESDGRVAERVGAPDADASTLRFRTGGLLVEADPRIRDEWLSHDRIRALEVWPHGGEFACQPGYGAWRVRGLLTPTELDTLLEQLPKARRLLE